MTIRLLIADDHELIRNGLRSMAEGSEIEIVGEAANCQEAIEMAEATSPHVVLFDVRLPEAKGRPVDCSGLTGLERLREIVPSASVIIFSAHDSPTYIARAVALGARDFLTKAASREKLLQTIREAAEANGAPRSDEFRYIESLMSTRQTLGPDTVLTQRETQVLRHLGLGLSNKEISLSLRISVETVKEHVQNTLRKISVSDRTQAAVWAVRNGLV